MYCPACGEEVEGDARYCRHCGADVADQDTGTEDTEPIQHATRVEHQCESCGEMLRSGEPPCKHCGGMEIDTRPVEPTTTTTSSDGGVMNTERHPDRRGVDNQGRDTQFYIGAVLGVVGVIVFPYVFFLVALPEAIAGLVGRSLQDSFPGNSKDNPFVTGSMLIMRWFGNFLILAFLVGVAIGLLVVL